MACRCVSFDTNTLLMFGDTWYSNQDIYTRTGSLHMVGVDRRDPTGDTFVFKDPNYLAICGKTKKAVRLSDAKAFEACCRVIWSSDLTSPKSSTSSTSPNDSSS